MPTEQAIVDFEDAFLAEGFDGVILQAVLEDGTKVRLRVSSKAYRKLKSLAEGRSPLRDYH